MLTQVAGSAERPCGCRMRTETHIPITELGCLHETRTFLVLTTSKGCLRGPAWSQVEIGSGFQLVRVQVSSWGFSHSEVQGFLCVCDHLKTLPFGSAGVRGQEVNNTNSFSCL